METKDAIGCDGRCDVRLLEKLQRAIGEMLAEHTRDTATPPRQGHLHAEAGRRTGPAPRLHAGAEQIVIDTIAELTRYPREILLPEAKFDEDLGIDSLKRVEIVTALLRRVGEPPADLQELGPLPLTIRELTDLAAAYIERSGKAAPAERATGGNGMTFPSAPPHERARDVSLRSANDAASFAQTVRGATPALLGERPFERQVVLISGSGHGLGKVIARQMAALGAHVIINSFHSRELGEQTTEEILSEGGQATHLWGSMAHVEQINRTFSEIGARFDRLDCYVHNASDGIIAPLDKVTEAHWEKAFRTNIVGLHLSAMLAARLMAKSGGGRIVTLSSSGAQRYVEYFGCVGPVKAAVESLTLYLARELAPFNVQVNAVSAGPFYGERVSAWPDAERLIPYWESLAPDGRLGYPEEISDAVVFLMSKAARKVNGTVLLVDAAASQKM